MKSCRGAPLGTGRSDSRGLGILRGSGAPTGGELVGGYAALWHGGLGGAAFCL